VRTATPGHGWLGAVAGASVLVAGRVGLRASLVLPAALLSVLAWGAALGLGLWLRSLDTHGQETMDAVRRDERLALARELHDVVAHHVAAIVVRTQAARLAAARNPQQLDEFLTEIESAGGQALTAMRQVVDLLRAGITA
jgi:signal transduction histidine kinase